MILRYVVDKNKLFCNTIFSLELIKTYVHTDVLSSVNMLDLENDLPDELISSPWGLADNIGANKPPAQGPGPGGIQNGIDNTDANSLRQMHLNHLLQVSLII